MKAAYVDRHGPRSQVVRHFSAKEIYAGAIPAVASRDFGEYFAGMMEW